MNYTNMNFLIFRLEYIQDTLNLINEILYSSLSKESCKDKIIENLDNINRASEIDNIIENI